jgi:diacylglycerol kinase family enzyme
MSNYFYVFDSFLQEPKYRSELIKIETRLATLGIHGRAEKITILKNIQEAVREAIKRGTETIVVVGNDKTVSKILPEIVDHQVMLGLIPLGEPITIATDLGIPAGATACDVLSRRVVKALDLGKANSHYFILQVTAPAGAQILCDGKYTVQSLDPAGTMVINNLGRYDRVTNPTDGRLEIIVPGRTSGRGWFSRGSAAQASSVFAVKKARVTGDHAASSLILDGQVVVKTPITIEAVPRKLKIIVGPHRSF